jgi:hypothetical protein
MMIPLVPVACGAVVCPLPAPWDVQVRGNGLKQTDAPLYVQFDANPVIAANMFWFISGWQPVQFEST